MSRHFILSDYLKRALEQAEYDKLEDATYVGRIPVCTGVIAFAASLNECKHDLQAALEEWLLLGLKLHHLLPVIEGIDLNLIPTNGHHLHDACETH